MNEIKFACPHCGQHIACDEGYCGYQIACPACEGAMIAPKLAAFGYGAPSKLSLALPVATPVPRASAAPGIARNWQARSKADPRRQALREEKIPDLVLGFLRTVVIVILAFAGAAVIALGILFAGCAISSRL